MAPRRPKPSKAEIKAAADRTEGRKPSTPRLRAPGKPKKGERPARERFPEELDLMDETAIAADEKTRLKSLLDGKGAPPKYKHQYAHVARRMCRVGATTYHIAQALGVTDRTIKNWQAKYEMFDKAFKLDDNPNLDDKVARGLYERAVGYTYESEKVFQYKGAIIRASTYEHVPPDPAAAGRWLAARQPDKWRTKEEVTVKDESFVEMWRAVASGQLTKKES